MLKIKNLYVYADKEIVKGISISINKAERVVLMGPNGSGKSTLANAIMGHPLLKVRGRILFKNKDITNLPPEERAKLGLMLLFQKIPSMRLSVKDILRKAVKMDIESFYKKLNKIADELGVKHLINKPMNNLSGGELKKMELLQMEMLNPELVIFDEIDSGLDVDSVKRIGKFIEKRSSLIITHQPSAIRRAGIKISRVYIMKNGEIVKEGDASLLKEVDEYGFE